jgi:hypothetical protein
LAVTYLGTIKHKSLFVWTLVATVLFTGRERGDKSRIHSKKILIRNWPPTNIIPVTATLDMVNTALATFVSTEAFAAATRNKKEKNRRGSRQYRMERKLPFMRCICI